MKAHLTRRMAMVVLGIHLAVAAAPAEPKETGIRTDRLTEKQLNIWKSIEQVFVAVSQNGQPLHPKLYSLWRWAQMSGHLISIELWDRSAPVIKCGGILDVNSTHGGIVDVEKSDPDGRVELVVIRLYLRNIDRAFATTSLPARFIQLKGLRKNERYARVLGHELIHAARILEDLGYARLCRELQEEATEILRVNGQRPHGWYQAPETQQRLLRIENLSKEIEAPAHAAEMEIYRELRQGQGARN
jgi:hypothetical protein